MAGGRNVQQSSQSGSSEDEQPKDANSGESSAHGQEQTEEKKPSKLKALWTKTGLDPGTLMMMFKGAIAPTIALAMYQAPAVAQEYTTLGYLVAIMSILGMPIMPRGKFIQSMLMNIIVVCLSAAVNLLAMYSAVQARLHTTPAGAPSNGYNSSASAVCGVFLFFQVYCINYLRAARPQFNFPAIVYSIFAIVAMSYAVMFPTMASAISFAKRLLEAFFSGFAIATGVHFMIFPMSSRLVIFKQMGGYLALMGALLKTQTAYMQSLESIDPVALHQQHEEEKEKDPKRAKKQSSPQGPLTTPVSTGIHETFRKLVDLHTKLDTDLVSAKREFAIGKLESKDISTLWKHLRRIFVPVLGLTTSINLLERRAKERQWDNADLSAEETAMNQKQIESLHATMKALHDPFAQMAGVIGDGFQHALLTLELTKAPKKKSEDEENKAGQAPGPGDAAFAESMKTKIDDFYRSKEVTLTSWCEARGIELPEGFFEESFEQREASKEGRGNVPEDMQRQLSFVLYIEYLLWRAGHATLELVLLADKMKQDGKLKHSKLIFPGSRVLGKWIRSVFGQEDFSAGTSYVTDMEDGARQSVFLGKNFEKRKDPEHLQPTNAAQRIGNVIRLIPAFFRHPGSAFGFRVACATMSLAIVGFLHDSQAFFLKQRLLWSEIMVAISMMRLAGQSTFNFVLRIFGTAVAMIGAYIIWYIVDGHAAGVLVFLFIWMMGGFYILVKFPKFVVIGILSAVTSLLIVGYELQVDSLGKQVAESNGQPAYPTYILAPYRLATVTGGIFVAWIWTIWPYPVTESSELRKDLGASLYMLANFTTIVHEIIQSRIKGVDGDPDTKGTHAYNLEKARIAVFGKMLMLVNQMRTNSAFSKFQLALGGRFPREEYEEYVNTKSSMHRLYH